MLVSCTLIHAALAVRARCTHVVFSSDPHSLLQPPLLIRPTGQSVTWDGQSEHAGTIGSYTAEIVGTVSCVQATAAVRGSIYPRRGASGPSRELCHNAGSSAPPKV